MFNSAVKAFKIDQVADPNQIASLVFNGPGNTISTCDPSVQPLLNRVTFNVPCSVGMSGVGTFSSVATRYGNGPGQTTNGFDLQTLYDMPLAAGDLTLGLNATRITELKTGPTSLDGVVVSGGLRVARSRPPCGRPARRPGPGRPCQGQP